MKKYKSLGIPADGQLTQYIMITEQRPCVRSLISAEKVKGNIGFGHKLNMELDLQSIFGLLCTAVLAEAPQPHPIHPHLDS